METRVVIGVTIDDSTRTQWGSYIYAGWVEFGMPYGQGRQGHGCYIRCRMCNNDIHNTVRNVFAFAGCDEVHTEAQVSKAVEMAERIAKKHCGQ